MTETHGISHDDLPAGHVLGERFIVERRLGRGRTAAVYRALDGQTRTPVALKVFDPHMADDPTAFARFEREVRILRTVDHPNVARLYDVVQDGELHVLVMELVAGTTARAHLERTGPLSIAELTSLARGTAAAVAACHRRGVLHRDLAPQNVLITPAGHVKLVDFGVARLAGMTDLTRTGVLLGTAAYLAPECFHAPTADVRADLYALGALLYELATGQPPHGRGGLPEVMARQLATVPEPVRAARPEVPDWLDAVIMRCLRADPAARYQTADELLRDLERRERAEAVREARLPPAPCLGCGVERIPGLPFCQCCGRFERELVAPGPCALVLYACDGPDALAADLHRLFPDRPMRGLRAALEEAPVVLVSGISRPTAAAVARELGHHAGELRVVDQLPWRLRLPRVFLGMSLIPLLMLPAFDTVLGRLGVTAAGALGLVALYRRQTRPLLAGTARTRDAASEPALLPVARALRELNDPGLQAVVGRIVAGARQVTAGAVRHGLPLAADRPGEIARHALAVAGHAARCAALLTESSRHTLRARLAVAERRLAATQEPDEVAALVQARDGAAERLRDHGALEDAHLDAHVALHGALAALESVAQVMDAGTAEAALARVGQELADALARLQR